MQLHCLGTVGYHPNDKRQTSCYFLPESGIVLDCGSGAFRLSPLIRSKTLDILLSHSHLDHIIGLTFLLDVLYQCEQDGRKVDQVRVWGQAEKLDAIRKHLFHDLIFPAPLNCQWMPIDELDSFSVGDVDVSWRAQVHPGGSVAFRLDWPSANKRLVYATDTTGDVSVPNVQWSQGSDLLMHECYFRDEYAEWAEKTGHCWTARLIEVAQKSKPAKLLVTHVNPIDISEDPADVALIRSKVDAEIVLAEDDLVVDF